VLIELMNRCAMLRGNICIISEGNAAKYGIALAMRRYKGYHR
jgi:hypothetical protein